MNVELNTTLQEFLNITTSLSKERNLARLLLQVVESSMRLTNAEAGMVWLLDNTKRNLYLENYIGKIRLTRPAEFAQISLLDAHQRDPRNAVEQAAVTGQQINIANIYEYSGYQFDTHYQIDKTAGVKTRSCLTTPLIDNDGYTVGVLQLMTEGDKAKLKAKFSTQDETVVRAIGCQAAVAIENTKLFEENRFLIKALDASNKKLRQENKQLMEKIHGQYDFRHIVGDSAPIGKVFELIKKILPSDATVLILGETGTGKELIAHAIHYNGIRRDKPFVTQNCAALPENLLESELFGYKKGAFSGAGADKKGLIELADGGTLFLDEIGDMPLSLQAKILRVLQEKEVRPLGGTVARKVNVRIVAATHHDLAAKVKTGDFREDLFYRLRVFPIAVPALRDRKDDLPALIKHFLDQLSAKYEKKISGISPIVLNKLMQHEYPGNVRELRNIVERAILLADQGGNLLPEHFDDELMATNSPQPYANSSLNTADGTLKDMVEHYESDIIRLHLERNKWNQTQTAERLGVSRRTLIDKMARYKLNEKGNKPSLRQ